MDKGRFFGPDPTKCPQFRVARIRQVLGNKTHLQLCLSGSGNESPSDRNAPPGFNEDSEQPLEEKPKGAHTRIRRVLPPHSCLDQRSQDHRQCLVRSAGKLKKQAYVSGLPRNPTPAAFGSTFASRIDAAFRDCQLECSREADSFLPVKRLALYFTSCVLSISSKSNLDSSFHVFRVK